MVSSCETHLQETLMLCVKICKMQNSNKSQSRLLLFNDLSICCLFRTVGMSVYIRYFFFALNLFHGGGHFIFVQLFASSFIEGVASCLHVYVQRVVFAFIVFFFCSPSIWSGQQHKCVCFLFATIGFW